MRPSLSRLAAAGATAAAMAFPSPAPAADAVYGGTTRDGDAIVLKADRDAKVLKSIVIAWAAACGDGQRVPGGRELTPVEPEAGFMPSSSDLLVSRNAKGTFKGTQLTSADGGATAAAITVEIAGKLKAGRATGTLSAIAKVIDKATGAEVTSCQTGKVTWAATRSPGVVYGGTSSQGGPVVVRLDKTRKRVNDLLTTWFAPCTPAGFFRSPDHLVNFPVKRTGSFGNPFSFDASIDGGGKRHYDYTLAGRVSAKMVKGTLEVKLSETDGTGAAMGTCETGGLTFKATTG